jgi:glycyl-tRNA synthetase beta chain
VQAIGVGEPRAVTLVAKLAALREVAATPDFVAILQTFKRVLNISAKAEGNTADRAYAEPSEQALDRAVTAASDAVTLAVGARDFRAALAAMLGLRAPVGAFFDDVLVDDPDPTVKARRVGLLHRISTSFKEVADFSKISSR